MIAWGHWGEHNLFMGVGLWGTRRPNKKEKENYLMKPLRKDTFLQKAEFTY